MTNHPMRGWKFSGIAITDDQEQPDGSVHNHDWVQHYYGNLTYTDSAVSQTNERATIISQHIEAAVKRKTDSAIWGDGRTRRGLVIGSVQSGKTASMLGVMAHSLNQGTDIVVLLSGTKVSLMQQTVERMYHDLIPADYTRHSFILPKQTDANVPPERIGWSPSMTPARRRKYTRSIASSLRKGKKIILAVMKQKDHLVNVATILEDAIEEHKRSVGTPIHMLVIDDESDDASILDTQDTKSTPTRICRLWSGTKGAINYHRTHCEDLFATYVGYTATPQANILQDYENPLYPEHFIFSLKTPHFREIEGDEGTYVESEGITASYTGGELFYNTEFDDPEASLTCTEFTHGDTVDLEGPIPAFLVGAAIHLLEADKQPPDPTQRYATYENAMENHVKPYTMVYHPSALMGEQFQGKQSIIDWLNIEPDHENINPELVRKHMKAHETEWSKWIERFDKSALEWNGITGNADFQEIQFGWPQIKSAIVERVLPVLKIRVLNSDIRADDKPKFTPWRNPDNPEEFLAQTDCISIFVAGNVLGRGLTIEGLRISVFERSSSTPVQDTQMQMQRWFGYRGLFLPRIRLFLSQTQLQHFTQYHRSDVVVKNIVLSKEASIRIDEPIAFQPDILTSLDTVPTLKTSTSRRPIHVGKNPSFMVFEEEDSDKHSNLQALESFVSQHEFTQLTQSTGITIGQMSTTPIRAEDIAGFLETLEFTFHRPGPEHPDFSRWDAYNTNYDLGFAEGQICKTNGLSTGDLGDITTENSPYTIAAYLKVWAKSTVPNRSFTFAPEDRIWDGTVAVPSFNVVILKGNSAQTRTLEDCTGNAFNINLSERSLNSHFWGNSKGSANRYDDKLVDYHDPSAGDAPINRNGVGLYQGLPTPRYVQSGHPGLMVIRLVEDEAVPSLAVGFSMPQDGPAHLRANN